MSSSPTTKTRYKFLLVIALVVVILIAVALLSLPGLQKRWEAPLGPALALPTYTVSLPSLNSDQEGPGNFNPITQTSFNSSNLLPSTSTPRIPSSIQTLPASTGVSPSPSAAPLCGGPPVMLVLGVGVDTEDNSYTYGLGDAIRIARLDFVTPKVTVLSIPRDLWVEIPDISDHYGITHGKLNQSFLYGSPGMGYFDDPSAGPGLMARTLDLNFGLRVDHYGAVNMLTFARIVDAVGGIDIYLPEDVDGTPIDETTADMGYFDSGQRHFTGDEALRFSRIRKRYNDLTRADHQSMVLCALKEKILSPSVLPRIPQIIASFKDSVVTDLSLEQFGQMACLLPYLKKENLVFTSLPEEIMQPGRVFNPQMQKETFIMEADFDVIRQYVTMFLDGSWPTEAAEENTCQ